MINQSLAAVQAAHMPAGPTLPDFKVGDRVCLSVKIKEKGKERIQQYEGTVIQIRGSAAYLRMVTVRKMSGEIAVERIFPLPSPHISAMVIKRASHRVRRSKLFYLRQRQGRAAKVRYKQ